MCCPTQAQGGEEGASGRVIVFTNFRDGVAEIRAALQAHEPLITARSAQQGTAWYSMCVGGTRGWCHSTGGWFHLQEAPSQPARGHS